MTRPAQRLIVLILAAAALAACGVKPSSPSPPSGAQANDFPRTYPTY